MVTYHPERQQTSSASAFSRDHTPATERSQATPPILPDICERLVVSPSPGSDPVQQGDWLDDMLLKHYLSVVSWTLNENPRVVLLYRQLLPELALKHASLNHAALTISAAHCVATLSSSAQTQAQAVAPRVLKALIERSLYHHTCTLNLFAKQISASQNTTTMSHDDCIAMTLSAIFVLTSFITQLHPAFQDPAPLASPGAIDKSVALLNLAGPCMTFFEKYGAQIAASPLVVFFEDYMPEAEDALAPLPTDAEQGLEAIAALCDASSFPRHRELYAAAIVGLRRTFRTIVLNPGVIGMRFSWVVGEDATDFANLVYKRVPEALILLSCWAASLKPWPHWWASWATNFAGDVIKEVSRSIPPGYSQYLEWPRNRLGSQ